MSPSADLLDLYRASHYDLRLPSGRRITLRIGRQVPAALIAWANNEWPLVCISACNPRSQKLSAKANHQRMRDLHARIQRYERRVLAGVGRIPGHEWREPFLLVAGLGIDEIDTLALDFEQNAVVVVGASLRAKLRIYRKDWDSLLDQTGDLEAADPRI